MADWEDAEPDWEAPGWWVSAHHDEQAADDEAADDAGASSVVRHPADHLATPFHRDRRRGEAAAAGARRAGGARQAADRRLPGRQGRGPDLGALEGRGGPRRPGGRAPEPGRHVGPVHCDRRRRRRAPRLQAPTQLRQLRPVRRAEGGEDRGGPPLLPPDDLSKPPVSALRPVHRGAVEGPARGADQPGHCSRAVAVPDAHADGAPEVGRGGGCVQAARRPLDPAAGAAPPHLGTDGLHEGHRGTPRRLAAPACPCPVAGAVRGDGHGGGRGAGGPVGPDGGGPDWPEGPEHQGPEGPEGHERRPAVGRCGDLPGGDQRRQPARGRGRLRQGAPTWSCRPASTGCGWSARGG